MDNKQQPPLQAVKPRKAIVVLGPHRSGTSVVSRSLLTAGLDLGQHVLAANSDNPKGFFENSAIIEFNDRLLKHLGLCWDYLGNVDITQLPQFDPEPWQTEAREILVSEFIREGDIVLKDPRLCLLAPFWDQALRQQGFSPHYVLVLRHPLESAASQMTRRSRDPAFHFVGSTLSEGVLMWATYLHSALRFFSHHAASLASYDNFLTQPALALGTLAQRLSLSTDKQAVEDFCEEFIDARLRRHSPDHAPSNAMLQSCNEVYTNLHRQDPAEALDIGTAAKLADQLASQLDGKQVISHDLQRIYVAARHSAVESNLALTDAREELEKASRIIAHNEAQLATNAAVLKQQIERYASARTELIFERLENERMAIALSVAQDQVKRLSNEDPEPE